MKGKIKSIALHFCIFAYNAGKHFAIIDGLGRASSLAYQTLLSIVPLMIASIGAIGAFPAFLPLIKIVETFVFEHIVATSADQIHEYIQSFTQHATNLSATGIFFTLVSAVLMIFTMEGALNAIWQVKRRRQGLNAFLIYWAVLTILPILVGAALATSIYILSLPYIFDTVAVIGRWIPLLDLIPIALIWLAYTLLYQSLPNCKVAWGHAASGGLVAAILFEISKVFFAYYAEHLSSYTFIYGALATVPILLIWIYLCWAITLFGATIAAEFKLQHRHKIRHPSGANEV